MHRTLCSAQSFAPSATVKTFASLDDRCFGAHTRKMRSVREAAEAKQIQARGEEEIQLTFIDLACLPSDLQK